MAAFHTQRHEPENRRKERSVRGLVRSWLRKALMDIVMPVYHNWSMDQETDIRRGRHCVFAMHIHLVFVAKYRRKIFDGDAIERLRTIFAKVCEDFEARLVEVDGEHDHVHLLLEYPPKVCVSTLVNSLKGVSSRRLRGDRPDLGQHYYKGVLWSPSYFAASCGGAPISVVRQYIEQQRTPD